MIKQGEIMKRPEAAVDRVYQNELLNRFRLTATQLGDIAGVHVPDPRDRPPAPKLDMRFANVAVSAAKDLERTNPRRSHMLIIGRMPAFMRATGIIDSHDPRTTKEQKHRALSDIQQAKLAVRSIANNFPRMSRQTFRQIAYESAYMFTDDDDTLRQTVDRSNDNMWSMMHMLGVEGTLASIGLLPEDEVSERRDHPGVVLPLGTARIKQLADSPVDDGEQLLVDVHTNDQKMVESLRNRGGKRRVPSNERVFSTNWNPTDFSKDMPLRVNYDSVVKVQERLLSELRDVA